MSKGVYFTWKISMWFDLEEVVNGCEKLSS